MMRAQVLPERRNLQWRITANMAQALRRWRLRSRIKSAQFDLAGLKADSALLPQQINHCESFIEELRCELAILQPARAQATEDQPA